MTRKIPLFPLNTVLFPNSPLPLQIFETRYREMLRDCMNTDRKFGVVLIKSGSEVGRPANHYEFGTVAHILELGDVKRGSLPIIVKGEDRFKIISTELRTKSYLMGEIELITDEIDVGLVTDKIDMAYQLSQNYVSMSLALEGLYQARIELPEDVNQLCYYAGSITTKASKKDHQRLLEANDLSNRVSITTALLEEQIEKMEKGFMSSGPGKERVLFSAN